MKGIMVTLLTFCMTGMVMGQQFRDDDSFDNSGDIDSQQRTTTAQSGNPNALYTALTLDHIELLKNDGLQTPVKGFEVVDEVVLFLDGNTPQQNIGNIAPNSVSKVGDVLNLTLDDFDITTIKSSGLRYNYSNSEIGRFKTVRLHYRTQGAPSSNSMANSANPFGGPQPDDTAKTTYFPAPGPAPSPGDYTYMGPAAPRGIVFDDSKARQDNSSSFSPNWNSQPNPGNQVASGYDNRNLGSGFGGNQNFNNSPTNRNDSLQQINSNQSQFAQSNDFGMRRTNQDPNRTNPIRRQPAIQPSMYSTQNNQLAGNNANDNGRFSSTNVESFEERQLREIREARLKQAANIEQRQLNIAEAKLEVEEQELLNAQNNAFLTNQENIRRRNQLERREIVGYDGNGYDNNGYDSNGYDNNRNDPNELYQDQFPQNQQPQNQYANNVSMSDQLANGRFQNGAPPSRGGQFPQTGNGVSPMSIPGPNNGGVRGNAGQGGDGRFGNTSDGEANGNQAGALGQTGLDPRQNSTEGIVYFMLLASLGLNLYLGLISRSFYVRYNELADELRETFTATM